jgi:hypothetical protein
MSPALWNAGTREGLGSQWCDRLPYIPQDKGRKGLVWALCISRLLPEAHVSYDLGLTKSESPAPSRAEKGAGL